MYIFNTPLFLTIFIVFNITSCSNITVASRTEVNHNATLYYTSESCHQVINTPIMDKQTTHLNSDNITLISWNIEKGKNAGWKAELKKLSKGAQLVLLQEAIFIDEMKDSADEAVYWSFSPGYKTQYYNSGIMTLSSSTPELICSLQVIEPWLRSPKIASITRFQLKNNKQSLLLVNAHQINFTLGTKYFSRQLKSIVDILKTHEGPIILSGDFNTWSQARSNILTKMTQSLQLSPVDFYPDYRKKVFGYYLDHIFTRGFDIQKSYTVPVNTSDHNPLITTLSLQEVI